MFEVDAEVGDRRRRARWSCRSRGRRGPVVERAGRDRDRRRCRSCPRTRPPIRAGRAAVATSGSSAPIASSTRTSGGSRVASTPDELHQLVVVRASRRACGCRSSCTMNDVCCDRGDPAGEPRGHVVHRLDVRRGRARARRAGRAAGAGCGRATGRCRSAGCRAARRTS